MLTCVIHCSHNIYICPTSMIPIAFYIFITFYYYIVVQCMPVSVRSDAVSSVSTLSGKTKAETAAAASAAVQPSKMLWKITCELRAPFVFCGVVRKKHQTSALCSAWKLRSS